jgi:hypothetical protein
MTLMEQRTMTGDQVYSVLEQSLATATNQQTA